tara:strand:- start:42 stop:419 length:378 start_codon:yes stop_codon:yes gene_type:complete
MSIHKSKFTEKGREFVIVYEIDTADWSGGEDDRDACEWQLVEWFDSLAPQKKLAIFYAQNYAQDESSSFDPPNDGCPILGEVYAAESKAMRDNAPWVNESGECTTGFNLFLCVQDVESKALEPAK